MTIFIFNVHDIITDIIHIIFIYIVQTIILCDKTERLMRTFKLCYIFIFLRCRILL